MFHTVKNTKINRSTRISLILVLLVPLLAFNLHKEYFSLTKIDYNEKEQALQITMRLFTNDMNLALNKHFNQITELGTKKEIAEADKLLETYLNQTFSIWVNKHKTNYQYIGKEFEKDAMYVYLEIKNITEIKEIEVLARMLQEEFEEQENIVKVNKNDVRKSLILTKQNDKGLLNF